MAKKSQVKFWEKVFKMNNWKELVKKEEQRRLNSTMAYYRTKLNRILERNTVDDVKAGIEATIAEMDKELYS